jgi:RNA-binding protein
MTLTPSQRRDLRAKAHHLHPVVTIGQHGLTAAVLHEIDVALKAHELIKIRVFSDDRGGREAMSATICDALACAPVQHLGKLLIVWRPRPEEAPALPKKRAKTARAKPALRGPRKPRERAEASEAKAPRGASDQSRRGRSAQPAPPSGVPRAVATRRRRRSP